MKRYRSSITGRIVRAATALRHPKTTVAERVDDDAVLLRVSPAVLGELEAGTMGPVVVMGVAHRDDETIELTLQTPPARAGAELRVDVLVAAAEALVDNADERIVAGRRRVRSVDLSRVRAALETLRAVR